MSINKIYHFVSFSNDLYNLKENNDYLYQIVCWLNSDYQRPLVM